MFPSPPRSSLSKEVVFRDACCSCPAVRLSFCLEKELCSMFLFWLRCPLTFWELSILREVSECFSLHCFSLTCFKLHFLFWHGIHIKSACRKEPFSAEHSGYLICKRFMALWPTTLPGGGARCFCNVQLSSSSSREAFTACSHTSGPAWWNLTCPGRNFCASCLRIMFNKFCALSVCKGCFSVKLFRMDG